ncbi:MAG TPA: tetratricopeptide repeat protein, partial [Myxococcaceae bacterium]|nr:tetratricopeptide repeat protein [Myxococcaceae bacterium]
MKTPTNPPPLAALSWNAVRRGLRLAERDVKPPQGGGALALALCLLASTPAGAQSERALDSVRFGRVDAADRVAAELSACAQEECPRLRHLSLLSGYLELSRGNTVLAVKTLGARPPPPSLEPVHAYYLGLSLFYAREPRKAVKSLEQALKGAPPWLEPRIRAKLGEAWFEAGEAAPACAELEKVTNQIGAPELFYRRALCRAALNNGTGARSDWEYLAVNHPTHPYAESALAELARLPSPWKPSLDARSRRARAFSDAGGGAACLKELDAAQSEGLVRGDTAQGRWFLQRAGCLYAMGRASEADEAVERARKQGPTLVAAEAGLLQARRTLRTHDNDSARKQMADLVRAYPDEWPAREAAFLVGWLDLQLGKYEDALKSFDAYEKRYRGSGRRDDVLWLGAWARIRLGRYAEAAEKLQDLEKSFPRSEFTAQVRYWYARCVQYVKSPAEAASLYGKVVEQHPSTLYATFARERLRETGQPVPPPFGGVAPADPPPQPNDGLDLGRALASVGLYRDAAAEL